MKCALLTNRSLVRIDGDVAVDFLQNLVTCDMENLAEGEATFGALLTPQGKILFDFFCLRTPTGFLFDIADHLQADFIKRMTFYKLRAAVEIAPVDDGRKVYTMWGDTESPASNDGRIFADPRIAKMGWRSIAAACDTNADMEDYLQHRIEIGVPEGGIDFAYGDAFPHDAMMDQFSGKGAGIAFNKGCYVGQEVVSRMKHRGTARRRVVKINAKQSLPAPGSAVQCGEKSIGTLGSVSTNNALAMVRIDRLGKALATNEPVSIEGIVVDACLPDWVNIVLESA